MNKCLVCFAPLKAGDTSEYHRSCARTLFGDNSVPSLDLDLGNLQEAGVAILRQGRGLPGVQAKLSVDRDQADSRRMSLVGFHGRFILKPPVQEYEALPENEAFCMQLAGLCGIRVAPHGLVRCQGGELAYLSRRFDRLADGQKLAQEDFCQLSERPAADKYKGSLEAAARVLAFSAQIGLDQVRFLELNLFCWLSGNADMHLKNFSLYEPRDGLWEFSPAYDLVSTALVLPQDAEECALTLNGKKSRILLRDWLALAAYLGLPGKVFANVVNRLARRQAAVHTLCRQSFLPLAQQEAFMARWNRRLASLTEGNPVQSGT